MPSLTPAYRPISRTRQRYAPRARLINEINVTPMVDVMLVLLIIFMVAAPLLSVGVAVNLPKADAATLKADQAPLAVSVDARGRIFLQDTPIAFADLVPQLRAIASAGNVPRVYVRGDRNVSYGRMAAVVAEISAAGFEKVALVTEYDFERRK